MVNGARVKPALEIGKNLRPPAGPRVVIGAKPALCPAPYPPRPCGPQQSQIRDTLASGAAENLSRASRMERWTLSSKLEPTGP